MDEIIEDNKALFLHLTVNMLIKIVMLKYNYVKIIMLLCSFVRCCI